MEACTICGFIHPVGACPDVDVGLPPPSPELRPFEALDHLTPTQEHPVMEETTSPTGKPALGQLLVRALVALGTVALAVKGATAPNTLAHQISAVVVDALVVAGLMSQGVRR